MSSFKEATVYKVGESYLGKDVWAMDLMPPIHASHWSQAKQTTMKPTIVYSARQHANEVSSTSHVLKMAELLLTDPVYREKLKKVNVVVHPITNADGAQLAYDLQKTNPTHMLHAGYLGSLGVDVTSAQWDADPIYPESGIRPKIWRTWLPDIFLNPHGYPSHEWVQLFSEYAAWVRTRSVETRDYWTMRGWWMPGFGWLDDARYPRHKDEQMKLLNMITEYVKAAPATVALNERAYERYKRYSFDFDQKNFKLDFTNGVLIYKSIKGARANPQSPDFMTRQPNVTIWDGVTEAPDETARGDWMKLVANAGLQWDKAILEYLVTGHHEIERKVDPFWNGVSLTMSRPRPPKPAKDAEKKPSTEANNRQEGQEGRKGRKIASIRLQTFFVAVLPFVTRDEPLMKPGTRLGPYEIVGTIGAGGMGEVYRARDSRLGRDVAIKVLPSSFSADADRLHRFEQEARAAAALNHPNILAVHDIGTERGCAVHRLGAARRADASGSAGGRAAAGAKGGGLCRCRSRAGLRRRTRRGSPIVISNPRTCSSRRTIASRFSISDWRN